MGSGELMGDGMRRPAGERRAGGGMHAARGRAEDPLLLCVCVYSLSMLATAFHMWALHTCLMWGCVGGWGEGGIRGPCQ